ncbi:hypothetical protein DEA06_15400 [Microbacterium sp. Gd 4-13]|nr:hypothetical protein DEA06_15400 [Microbacterium sp. Gd 4-13]
MHSVLPLSFPDEPRGELDRAIAVLMTTAERVMTTQGRLRALLHAVQTVVGDIDLPTVLTRVVEAAVELVDAEYGAIGVVSPDGTSLDEFIHVGVDEDAAALIGHLPRGRGVLGALLADPRPIRMPHIGDDARAVGFPAHHPPMDSFLGVPVRVREEVFGNLYLTNRRGGVFSAEDEELLDALATTAGFAIQNARLFEEARLRERWMAAASQLSSALLSTPPHGAFDLIAGRVSDVSRAAVVAIVTASESEGEARVAAWRGPDEITIHPRVQTAQTFAAPALVDGERVVVRASEGTTDDPLRVNARDSAGSSVAVPLRSRLRSWGAIIVSRSPGEKAFSEVDAEVLANLALQASIALELADARAEQQRTILAEDRARIARDLHDHVIQQLFGAEMTLLSVAAALPEGSRRHQIQEATDHVDLAISQIRTIVFALSSKDATSVRHRIIDSVAAASGTLLRTPSIRFGGPVDHIVGGQLADDLVAAVTELLSNSIRHADADSISLEVTVGDDALSLVVVDDGKGMGDTSRRSGLKNLQDRAVAHGGTLQILSGPTGTRAHWSVLIGSESEVGA